MSPRPGASVAKTGSRCFTASRVTSVDIARVMREAFHIATTGRPGPVLVDLPKNIQQAKTQPVFPAEVSIRGYDPDLRASQIAQQRGCAHE